MGPWASNATQAGHQYDASSYNHTSESTVEYECGKGMIFDAAGEPSLKEYTCQWNGTWNEDPTSLPNCKCSTNKCFRFLLSCPITI